MVGAMVLCSAVTTLRWRLRCRPKGIAYIANMLLTETCRSHHIARGGKMRSTYPAVSCGMLGSHSQLPNHTSVLFFF